MLARLAAAEVGMLVLSLLYLQSGGDQVSGSSFAFIIHVSPNSVLAAYQNVSLPQGWPLWRYKQAAESAIPFVNPPLDAAHP